MATVIGKVCKDPRYPTLCDWVIQTSSGDIVTGRCTVFHGLSGYRYGTMSEGYFSDLRQGAENMELAGKVYPTYTMKELFELKAELSSKQQTTPTPTDSGYKMIDGIRKLLDKSIIIGGVCLVLLVVYYL